MKSKGKVVELFSGFGSVTEWFRNNGYDVQRYDADPYYGDRPDTSIVNVLDMKPEDLPMNPKFFWASPPCDCFSPVGMYRYWISDKGTTRPKTLEECHYIKGLKIADEKAVRYHRDLVDALVLVRHVRLLIERTEPEYYAVENPVGAMRHLFNDWDRLWFDQAMFGTSGKKPTYLFGRLPRSFIQYIAYRKRIQDYDWEKTYDYMRRPMRKGTLGLPKRIRAMLPYELGRMIGYAIEGRLENTTKSI